MDLERERGWEGHAVIVCSRGFQALMVLEGTLARCEICSAVVSVFEFTQTKKETDPEHVHLICQECFQKAKKTEVRYGGRIRNNKLVGPGWEPPKK